MSDDLEAKLRLALRAVDPPQDLAPLLAARLNARSDRARGRRQLWAWSGSLAASVLLVAGYQYQRHREEVSAGLEARRQVLEALHVTNEKLDLAFRAVHELNERPDARDSGA